MRWRTLKSHGDAGPSRYLIVNRPVFHGNVGPGIRSVGETENPGVIAAQRVTAEIERKGDVRVVLGLDFQLFAPQIDILQHGDGAALLFLRRRHGIAQRFIGGHGRAVGGGERRLRLHAAETGEVVCGIEHVTIVVANDADVFKLCLAGYVDHADAVGGVDVCIEVAVRQQIGERAGGGIYPDFTVFAAKEANALLAMLLHNQRADLAVAAHGERDVADGQRAAISGVVPERDVPVNRQLRAAVGGDVIRIDDKVVVLYGGALRTAVDKRNVEHIRLHGGCDIEQGFMIRQGGRDVVSVQIDRKRAPIDPDRFIDGHIGEQTDGAARISHGGIEHSPVNGVVQGIDVFRHGVANDGDLCRHAAEGAGVAVESVRTRDAADGADTVLGAPIVGAGETAPGANAVAPVVGAVRDNADAGQLLGVAVGDRVMGLHVLKCKAVAHQRIERPVITFERVIELAAGQNGGVGARVVDVHRLPEGGVRDPQLAAARRGDRSLKFTAEKGERAAGVPDGAFL